MRHKIVDSPRVLFTSREITENSVAMELLQLELRCQCCFKVVSDKVCDLKSKQSLIQEALKDLFQVELTKSNLRVVLCSICEKTIKDFREFKQKVEETQKKFQESRVERNSNYAKPDSSKLAISVKSSPKSSPRSQPLSPKK